MNPSDPRCIRCDTEIFESVEEFLSGDQLCQNCRDDDASAIDVAEFQFDQLDTIQSQMEATID